MLGLKLKRKEGGGDKEERHGRSTDGGGGGLRVRRVRILSSRLSVG